MGTGAIIGGLLGLGGLGLQVGGAISQGQQDQINAAAARELAKEQFEKTRGDLLGNFGRAIEQSRANTEFATRTQGENFAAVLGNARDSASLEFGGIGLQEGLQTESASQQATNEAGQIAARSAVSGAGGGSSRFVKQQQRDVTSRQISGIGEQADISREAVGLRLSQTEEEANRRLRQNLESITTQQSQFEENAAAQLEDALEQAKLDRFSTTFGIPNAGQIDTATALDALSAGVDFGSTLVDLFA